MQAQAPDAEVSSEVGSDDDSDDIVTMEPLNLDPTAVEPTKLERQEWVHMAYELTADVRHQIQSMCCV